MINGGKKFIAAGMVACATITLGGCVERKITIGSDPPGALVSLNDVDIGRTPVSVPFTWYGDYDVRLRLEKNVGTPEDPIVKHYYLHTDKKTVAPWFEIIPIDLFAELWPGQFKDEQVWAFPVPEVADVSDADLLERAKELKGQLESTSDLKNRK